jgi:acyl carrier protein
VTTAADAVTVEVLALITGTSREACARRETLLEQDLGLDSLALLEVVETLQNRLAIVVPDEITARVRTIADLQDAVSRILAAS